jgi:putative transposase
MKRRNQKRKDYFYTELRIAGGVPLLVQPLIRDKIVSGLRWTCENRGLRIYDYTLLPDRLVMIANTAWGELREVIESYKGFSSKAVMLILRNGKPQAETGWIMHVLQKHGGSGRPEGIHIWEENAIMETIFRQEEADRVSLDIRNRAVKMGFVSRPEHYLLSSASPLNPLDGWIVEPTDPWS